MGVLELYLSIEKNNLSYDYDITRSKSAYEGLNSSPPGQNGRHIGIFLNETDKIPIQISLKLITRRPTDNESALVRLMAWRRTGGKPLPEPRMTQLLTHICGTGGR